MMELDPFDEACRQCGRSDEITQCGECEGCWCDRLPDPGAAAMTPHDPDRLRLRHYVGAALFTVWLFVVFSAYLSLAGHA